MLKVILPIAYIKNSPYLCNRKLKNNKVMDKVKFMVRSFSGEGDAFSCGYVGEFSDYTTARDKAEGMLDSLYKDKDDAEFYDVLIGVDYAPENVQDAQLGEMVYVKRLFDPDYEEIAYFDISKVKSLL